MEPVPSPYLFSFRPPTGSHFYELNEVKSFQDSADNHECQQRRA